jgi:hypothetical protein
MRDVKRVGLSVKRLSPIGLARGDLTAREQQQKNCGASSSSRTREPTWRTGPLQRNLFASDEDGLPLKVILGNAMLSARKLPAAHDGRGGRCTTEQRASWRPFVRVGTRGMRLTQRAGRPMTPKGRLTQTLSAKC